MCGASEAEYIASRRLTASEVAMTMSSGACSESSCSAVNCEAPAITRMLIAMISASGQPASAASTPKSMPKGTITSRNGSASRTPSQKAPRIVESVMLAVPSASRPL